MGNKRREIGRRAFLGHIAVAGAVLLARPALADARPAITVWKDPSCGCCAGWIEHLRGNGFVATVIETADMASIKSKQRVPADLASCHTAVIDGYTIEGHVPAQAILRLITEKPAGRGLAVPGMPAGSPGMEGGRPEIYDVVLFGDDSARRFARYLGDKPA